MFLFGVRVFVVVDVVVREWFTVDVFKHHVFTVNVFDLNIDELVVVIVWHRDVNAFVVDV